MSIEHGLRGWMTLKCFYCHKVIEAPPIITWMGATGEIELHPSCVLELTIRLIRDLHEVECTYPSKTTVWIPEGSEPDWQNQNQIQGRMRRAKLKGKQGVKPD